MKKSTTNKHVAKLRHKLNLRSGLVRLGIPLFIIAVAVAAIVGVVVYSQQNQSHASNWTLLASGHSDTATVYACKTLVGYSAGRRYPVYQMKMMAHRLSGRPAALGPKYFIAVGNFYSTPQRYSEVSSNRYDSNGNGVLTANALLDTSNSAARFEIFVTSGSSLKGGVDNDGPYAASRVVNCN